MARLLQENPGLKVLVVGHTDTVGSFDSVEAFLISGPRRWWPYLTSRGVSAGRLFPVGVEFRFAGRHQRQRRGARQKSAGGTGRYGGRQGGVMPGCMSVARLFGKNPRQGTPRSSDIAT